MEGRGSVVQWKERSPDILLLVLLGDLDVASVGLQVVGGDLAKDLLVHGEEHLKGALLDVVVPGGRGGRRHASPLGGPH